jgi:hypothetical protein
MSSHVASAAHLGLSHCKNQREIIYSFFFVQPTKPPHTHLGPSKRNKSK